MNRKPPDPGRLIQRIVRALDRAAAWPAATLWLVIAIGGAAIAAADMMTALQLSLFLFYVALAGLAAWCRGEKAGFVVTIMVAFTATAIRHYQTRATGHGTPLGIEAWNLLARTMMTGLFVVIVGGLRAMIALERWHASTDGLTGALNKQAFQQRMEARVAAAADAGQALVLCFVDLDGFKRVNDAHGHAAGDHVLQLFSRGAAGLIRAEDLFARIGGDEFVALLTAETMPEGDRLAAMVHERLRDVLEATGYPVTCSMGALVADGVAMAARGDYVAMADTLMYEVKRSGKNALRTARLPSAAANPESPTADVASMVARWRARRQTA